MRRPRLRIIGLLTGIGLLAWGWGCASGGLPGVGDLVPDQLGAAGALGLADVMGDGRPITTEFEDTHPDQTRPADFEPGGYVPFQAVPRDSLGRYLLEPGGRYDFYAESYCIKAGTHGPSGGNGYLYAPLRGPRAAIVQRIVDGAAAHPDIPQRDIQVLLWAIIARVDFSQMDLDKQRTAARLLSPEELFELNGGALGLVSDRAARRLLADVPTSVRRVVEAELALRRLLTEPGSTYEQLERVAVLAGVVPEEGDLIERGQWSWHPDGFYVRYLPYGYQEMYLQIYVPPESEAGPDEAGPDEAGQGPAAPRAPTAAGPIPHSPSGDVAVPAGTARQRLVISPRPSGPEPQAGDCGSGFGCEGPSCTRGNGHQGVCRRSGRECHCYGS